MSTIEQVDTKCRGAKDGVKRRTWSLEERRRIVAEALSPGASVAEAARRHGLHANLIFRWLRRSREGWLDRRRTPATEMAAARMSPELAAQTFVPVELLELKPAAVSPALLDADVDTDALRRVLFALSDL